MLFLSAILAKIQKLFNIYLKLWRHRYPQTSQVVVQNGMQSMEWNWQYLPKLYTHSSFLPAFSLLEIHPEATPPTNKQNNTKQMFIQCGITGTSKTVGTT